MSSSIFWAAFFASTLGWISLQTFRYTVLMPILKIARQWLKDHAADARAAGVTKECKCCVCGDKHEALLDKTGSVKQF